MDFKCNNICRKINGKGNTRYGEKIRKAIITVAGFDIRLLPATKVQPKEMIPIVDKSTLQYIS